MRTEGLPCCGLPAMVNRRHSWWPAVQLLVADAEAAASLSTTQTSDSSVKHLNAIVPGAECCAEQRWLYKGAPLSGAGACLHFGPMNDISQLCRARPKAHEPLQTSARRCRSVRKLTRLQPALQGVRY